MPINMFADGYTELWKKVDDAVKRDLPKTQIQHLESIAAKAEKEKNYGQLLNRKYHASNRKRKATSRPTPHWPPYAMPHSARRAANAAYKDTQPTLSRRRISRKRWPTPQCSRRKKPTPTGRSS